MDQATKSTKKKKKWSEDEINTILTYLLENGNIEAPTAQIYYKKLIQKTGINATWDIIKFKMRHLKASFKKANDWRQSTGAGLLEADSGVSSVKGKLLQMCPHFDKLSEIFGEKRVYDAFPIQDSGDFIIDEDEVTDTFEINESDALPAALDNSQPWIAINCTNTEGVSCTNTEGVSCTDTEGVSCANTEQVAAVASTPLTKKSKEFAAKLRRHAPKSSASQLLSFQEERSSIFKMKIEWEKEKHEKDVFIENKRMKLEEGRVVIDAKRMKMEEEKFKMEMDIKYRELQLKEKQMESEEKLAILALEKDERIKKLELELKYKTGG